MWAKDTEAWREMMRMNEETFWDNLAVTFYCLSPFLAKLLTEKLLFIIICSLKRKKTIINYHLKFEHVQTAWQLMIVEDSAW